MATAILVRHGRTTANATGLLAGRAVGVSLDQIGRDQAALTGDRLAAVPVVGVVSSPLERCQQTARLILDRQAGTPYAPVDLNLTECDYGQWQGRTLSDLATEDLWPVVQSQPSAVVFPAVNPWPRCRLGQRQRFDATMQPSKPSTGQGPCGWR
ncbi:Adenosylcobalamin/alpha-ribazole phosphatase [Arthrobacter sp. Bi26]|nr:Adenosylcobalamin/alpha-ribazole phosphatase [Arthrobacter sp. Bi26]